MKTKILALLTLAASVFTLSSCDEKWEPAAGEGTLSLRSMGVEVSTAMDVISRAEYDLSNFIVKVSDADGNLEAEWKYSEMPEVFSLVPGKYSVSVISHEVQKAEWERPFFEGSKSFEIENNKITEIGVVNCKFASLKVSIKFSDELRAAMGSDVKVTVVANDNGELVYTPEETRAGYFEVVDGSMTLVATFTGTVNGYKENFFRSFEDIAAGQHRIITFSLKGVDPTPPGESGNIDPSSGVNVDVSVTDEAISGGLDVEEDNGDDTGRPGDENFGDTPDQPENPDQPVDPEVETITFDAAELSFDAPNAVGDGVNGLVTIKVADGISHLIVKIESDNSSFIASLADLNFPQEFDLAYPGDSETAINGLGLPTGAAVIDKTEVPFDISQFIPLLAAFPGTHKFTITVTDNKNHQVAKTLTFIAQ